LIVFVAKKYLHVSALECEGTTEVETSYSPFNQRIAKLSLVFLYH